MTWKPKLNNKLTLEKLKAHVHYNPETGIVVRACNTSNQIKGSVVGSVRKDGYLYGMVLNKRYLVHRLIWFYMTGSWPEKEIDHKNLNKADNKWKNLRPATRSGNVTNKAIPDSNTSGFKGVSFKKGYRTKPWRATIHYDGKCHHLGMFATPEEAHSCYFKEAVKRFGEFARAA